MDVCIYRRMVCPIQWLNKSEKNEKQHTPTKSENHSMEEIYLKKKNTNIKERCRSVHAVNRFDVDDDGDEK